MTLGFILALYAVCTICRAVIFKRRDINPIFAFIPAVNKYKMGKMVGSKKLAKFNMIMHPLLFITFMFCFGYEIWIIKEYSYAIQVPKDGFSDSRIDVLVPDDVALIAVWSKYFLIAVAAITIVVWCMMMWKFTIQHERNPWWIMVWAIIPTIAYIAFAVSSTVVINGKKYTTKRVEVGEVKTNITHKKKKLKNKTLRKRNKNEEKPA